MGSGDMSDRASKLKVIRTWTCMDMWGAEVSGLNVPASRRGLEGTQAGQDLWRPEQGQRL